MTTELTTKEQTLVGIGAAIASGCQPCTAKYVQAARAAGACERSIRLAIETALSERHKATDAMADWAREVQGTVPVVDDSFRADKRKNVALIAAVAAHVVHSGATLSANLAQASDMGWSAAQVQQALGIGFGVADAAEKNADAVVGEAATGTACATGSCGESVAERRDTPSANKSTCGCTTGCAGA